jgi:hypothetical protein
MTDGTDRRSPELADPFGYRVCRRKNLSGSDTCRAGPIRFSTATAITLGTAAETAAMFARNLITSRGLHHPLRRQSALRKNRLMLRQAGLFDHLVGSQHMELGIVRMSTARLQGHHK